MTVKELKAILNECPDNMDIFMDERITEFTYGLLNSVTIRGINFKEDPLGEVLSNHEAVIFSED